MKNFQPDPSWGKGTPGQVRVNEDGIRFRWARGFCGNHGNAPSYSQSLCEYATPKDTPWMEVEHCDGNPYSGCKGYQWDILCEFDNECPYPVAWHRGIGICNYHLKHGCPYILYRHFDSTNELLYIGITSNPSARASLHRASSEWWWEVMNGGQTTYESFPTKKLAHEAEIEAIEKEKPQYNKHHNGGSDDDESDM